MSNLGGATAPDAEEHLRTARAHWGMREFAQALTYYRAALNAGPEAAALLSEVGEALLVQGEIAEARDVLSKAVALEPENVAIGFNLAVALYRSGDVVGALLEIRRTESLAPLEAKITRARLSMEIAHGDPSAADTAKRLAAASPSDAEALRDLVRIDSESPEAHSAHGRLLALCRTAKADPESWRALARFEYNRANYAKAMELLDEGIARTDDPALRFIRTLTLPKVPYSRGEILKLRAAMDDQLSALLAGGYNIPNVPKSVGQTAFHLPYHGLNDRHLQKKIAAAHLAVAPHLSWTAPHCGQRKSPRGKIRIGFISAYLKRHAVGRIIGGIIKTLDRNVFEVFLVHAPGERDSVSDELDASASGAITVPAKLDAAREAIARLELDILFYTDIGMDPFTYYLAFSRLARVQAVQPGHPITTGIPTIDVFISSAAAEPAHAQDHYSEELICLKGALLIGMPGRYKLERPCDLGLPAGRTIYACPSSIYKFHPDLDELLSRICAKDPNATLVVVGQRAAWYEFLYQRMARRIPDLSERLVILPYLKVQEFYSLLKTADAVLDTVRFSGGNTSLDAFSVGTPMVTLEGDALRSLSTTGMYRQMGLSEFVAPNEEAYVDRALRTAHDRPFRDQASRAITERANMVFDDPSIREELECHLRALALRA